jgi:hypothetical protein
MKTRISKISIQISLFAVVFYTLLFQSAAVWAQPGPNGDLPENMVIFVDRSINLPITERNIVRSDLNGANLDTLAVQFGEAVNLSYIVATNEYMAFDPNRSRIIRIHPDFSGYTLVRDRITEVVLALDYDTERDRYFYSRFGATPATRGMFYFDGPNGDPQQFDNRESRHIMFHADSNAVYYAIDGTGIVKHQFDRDERSVLIPFNNATRGMHLDTQRNELYIVHSNNLYRFNLNTSGAQAEEVMFLGFGVNMNLSVSMNDSEQILYASATSGWSVNIIYEIPLNDLDSEVEFSIPFTNQVQELHYNPVRNELVVTDLRDASLLPSYLKGYDLDRKITRNYTLISLIDVAVDPEAGIIYGLDNTHLGIFDSGSTTSVLFKMDIHGGNREILYEFNHPQREIKLDPVNNRLLILGFGDKFDEMNIWSYDLDGPRDQIPEVRLNFDSSQFQTGRVLYFDADYERDIVFVNLRDEGIFACPAEEDCEMIKEQPQVSGAYEMGRLAYNPDDEVLYFFVYEMSGISITHRIEYVSYDGTNSGTLYELPWFIDAFEYDRTMGKLVWSLITPAQDYTLRYLDPNAAGTLQSRIFFSGRDIRGMGFVIGNPSSVSVDGEGIDLPVHASLMQNYPNPFNPSTSIRFELPESSEVRLAVYDLTGRLVQVLEQGHRAAGVHTVSFDAGSLASGVYLYRLETPGFSQTMKMTLIK